MLVCRCCPWLWLKLGPLTLPLHAPSPQSPPGLIKLFNRNEDMIATVVGHECAHAVARHSSEKLSLGLFIALSVQVSQPQHAVGGVCGQGSGALGACGCPARGSSHCVPLTAGCLTLTFKPISQTISF